MIKLKETAGDPQSVVNQLRALMMHFNRLVEDDGLVKRFWGHVRAGVCIRVQGDAGGLRDVLGWRRGGGYLITPGGNTSHIPSDDFPPS